MQNSPISCRPGCAACCIAPSISSPIPNANGCGKSAKKAGQACVQLDEQLRCKLFGKPDRPAVCSSLQPSLEMCGTSTAHAMQYLSALELATRPDCA